MRRKPAQWPTALALFPVVVVGAGCSSSGRAPLLPSSSGQTAYAIHYNEELLGATKAVGEAHTREKTLSSGFAAHLDELKKPDWTKVELVIDDSDQAGRSADFAAAQADATAVRSFWDAERNEITAKVNGNAQHTLKQAGCSAETAGPISFALNDAIAKQLQKKLRSKNEAFVILERYKTSLGPQNVASLEKLADEISEASYDVHVLMVVASQRVKRVADDKEDVKKTLDRFVKEETDFQNELGRVEADKRASQERVTAAQKSKSEIDKVAKEAEAISKDMDNAIDTAKKEYEGALKQIKAKVEEKKKSEPAAAPGKNDATKPPATPKHEAKPEPAKHDPAPAQAPVDRPAETPPAPPAPIP